MRSYYILRSGRLSQKDYSILFASGALAEHTLDEDLCEEEHIEHIQKSYLPVQDIEDIHFFGETDINSKALGLFSKNGICCHFYNYHGWYVGSFTPKKALISGETLVRQSEHYLDNAKRVVIAQELIKGSLYGMREVLRPHCEKNPAFKEVLKEFKDIEKLLVKQNNIFGIMGLEGNARIKYYKCINEILPSHMEFEKRVKNPPDNAVNALISFVNSLVYTAILKEVYSTTLNPSIGYLHEPSERRFTLVLDISEIFKPLIGDKLLLELVNNRKITLAHFDKALNYCYLNEAGRKIVIAAFDEKIKSTIQHKKLGRAVSWKRIIRMELYKLLKHITSDQTYTYFRLK